MTIAEFLGGVLLVALSLGLCLLFGAVFGPEFARQNRERLRLAREERRQAQELRRMRQRS